MKMKCRSGDSNIVHIHLRLFIGGPLFLTNCPYDVAEEQKSYLIGPNYTMREIDNSLHR